MANLTKQDREYLRKNFDIGQEDDGVWYISAQAVPGLEGWFFDVEDARSWAFSLREINE